MMVTRITALYAGAQLLPAPLLGQLSDRMGQRPVLLGYIGAGSLVLLMGGLALAIAQAIKGASLGVLGITQAAIADGTSDDPSRRTDAFGLLGAGLGPAAGGLLGGVNPHLPFLVRAAVGVINLVIAAIRLSETCVRHPNSTIPTGTLRWWQRWSAPPPEVASDHVRILSELPAFHEHLQWCRSSSASDGRRMERESCSVMWVWSQW